MNRTISGLDVVIRKIEKSDIIPDGYKLLVFDEYKCTITKNESSVFSFGKRTGRYIVSSNEIAKVEQFSVLLDNGIGLNVNYSARCGAGCEEKVLKSLFDREKIFESILNEKIGFYIRDFIREQGNKLTYAVLKSMQEGVYGKCLEQTGLIVISTIVFQRQANLKKILLKGDPLSVRVNDYNNSLNLEYEVEVQPLEADLELALKRDLAVSEIKQNLNEIIFNEIWKNASLNQFCLSLNESTTTGEFYGQDISIKGLISASISSYLESEGREMTFLRLSSASIENIIPPEQIDIEHKQIYKIADDNEGILVKSNISLRLKDISLYKKAEEKYHIKKQGKSFKDWFVENVITPVVKVLFFTKKYEDILIEANSIETQIKQEISIKAKELGFGIQQHMYMPENDNILVIINGFEVRMDNSSFTTKSSSYDIKFNIKVKGKITDLRFLKNKGLLSPKINIADDIKAGIRSALEYKILDIPPEKIYLRNESPTSLGQQKSVEQELQHTVIDYLTDSYYVDKNSLTVIINFSEREDIVHRAYEQLKRNKISFEVNSTPSNKEVITFKVIYEITGIRENGWDRFSNQITKKTEEIVKEMGEALENKISSSLNNYAYDEILEFTADGILEAKIFTPAFNAVSETFGLYVQINSCKKLQTKREVGMLEINSKITETSVDEIKENISIARDQQRLVLEGYKDIMKEAIKDRDFELVEKVQEKISNIEKTIKGMVVQTTKSLEYTPEEKVKPKDEKNVSGDDYIEVV